jgi:hypothetical protein
MLTYVAKPSNPLSDHARCEPYAASRSYRAGVVGAPTA